MIIFARIVANKSYIYNATFATMTKFICLIMSDIFYVNISRTIIIIYTIKLRSALYVLKIPNILTLFRVNFAKQKCIQCVLSYKGFIFKSRIWRIIPCKISFIARMFFHVMQHAPSVSFNKTKITLDT